jgi:hypothetical protein
MPILSSWPILKLDRTTLYRTKKAVKMAVKTKANGDTPKATTAQLDAFAQRQRHLADQLRAHGLDGMLDVPKIVIVGSQSAGKPPRTAAKTWCSDMRCSQAKAVSSRR